MKWLRHDCEIDDHPDVIFAGFYGARIAEALCRTSKKFDLGGIVPAKYATPIYLSRQIGLDVDLCRKGLEDATRRNPDAAEDEEPLIVRDSSGNVTIPGWDNINGDREIERIREKAKERKARYKARHQSTTERPQNVPGTFLNVTERDGTKGTGDGTGRDVTEQNETRQDPPKSPPCEGDAVALPPEPDPIDKPPSKSRPKGVPPTRFPAVLDAFNFWRVTCGHPKAVDPEPEGKIAARIDAVLQKHGRPYFDAICRGAAADPWEGRRKNDTLDILLREGNQERMRSLDPQQGGGDSSRGDQSDEAKATKLWYDIAKTKPGIEPPQVAIIVEMLGPRTLDALRVIDSNPIRSILCITESSFDEKTRMKREFVQAWVHSGLSDDVEGDEG